MKEHILLNKHRRPWDDRVFIIAEMSANHFQDKKRAFDIIDAAAAAGADAVKLQTYTPDTMTLDAANKAFLVSGTTWGDVSLYELYKTAFTPWDWHQELFEHISSLGMEFFSTPFDESAVDLLESYNVLLHKVASFELVDIPLLRKIGSTRKPVIMSTGMATLAEIAEAVETLRTSGCTEIILLKCTSAYPAPVDEANLRTIPNLADAFGVHAGLSDHTLSIAVPVAAVALGARVIEKHLTLSRSDGGPDASFSLEPAEFAQMVRAVRDAEKALGRVCYEVTDQQRACLRFRRSLYVVENICAGERFTPANVRSIRPGNGMHTRNLEVTLGRRASRDIARGTPLAWDMIGGAEQNLPEE